jgi:mono/diheme cytochrome c family protein
MSLKKIFTFSTLTQFFLAQSAFSANPKKVQEIFARNCGGCHESQLSGRLKHITDLKSLTTSEFILPKNPEKSPIFFRLTAPNEAIRMPLRAPPLKKEDIETIREWILEGAKEGNQPLRKILAPIKKIEVKENESNSAKVISLI